MSTEAEAIKKSRSTAKGLFTRSNNAVTDAIKYDDDPELVERKMFELTNRYKNVQEIHENYVTEIEEDQSFDKNTEESWLSEITQAFSTTERMALAYIKTKKKAEEPVKNEEVQQCSTINTLTESEKFSNLREFEKTELVHEANTANKFMEETRITGPNKQRILKEYSERLEKQLNRCKNAQAQYLTTISAEEMKKELSWTDEIYDIYSEVSTELALHITSDEKSQDKGASGDTQDTQQKLFRLKLQPMPLPKFDGSIRDYPRFKHDFKTQVVPSVAEVQQPYVLKSCLVGTPLEIVKNVDHSVTDMWKRLDDRYAEPSKVIDVIMNEIKKLPSLGENCIPEFILMVDVVERAFRDLERLGLEGEVSNASTVCSIEEKLPLSERLLWSNKVKTDIGFCKNKFPDLLEFLLERKDIFEYALSDLRSSDQDPMGKVCYTEQVVSQKIVGNDGINQKIVGKDGISQKIAGKDGINQKMIL